MKRKTAAGADLAAAAPRGTNRHRPSRTAPWRRIVQVAFFALIAAIAVNHGLATVGKDIPFLSTASLHAVCPFGGVVTVYDLVTAGTWVKKVHSASVVLGGIGLLLALLFGPVFCGWVCPFGSLQEWIGKLGRRLLGRRYNRVVPGKLDRVLRYARYVTLAWVVYMTAVTGTLVFEAWDPYWALFNFWTGEVALAGILVLAGTVALSFFVERPFCKYACPYGAFLGLFNLVRVFGIRRQPSTCTSCKACSRACPMNIDVASKPGRIRDHQCITCLECTSENACPVADTVTMSAGAPPAPPRKEMT
jgi:polyferredoxin